MTSNRSRYSTAPTYGMQKRPSPKKQAVPVGPAYPPAQPVPNGPYAPPMQGYGQQASPVYTPPMGKPPNAYVPQQPAYIVPPVSIPQQQAYGSRQPTYQPPVRQQATAPVQPLPYYPQQPYAQQPIPQEYSVRQKTGGDQWLQIMLLAVLPILFILTLLVSAPILKFIFIGAGVLSLIGMWMQGSFVSSARATLTLVYGALMLVCIVSLLTGNTPRDTRTSAQGGNGGNVTTQSGGNGGTSGNGMAPAGANANVETTPSPTSTPEPDSGESSAAWQRLQQFFQYWKNASVPDMLTLVSPAWKSAQTKSPETELFLLLANRQPLDQQFEKISNTEADSTRTITMTSVIDKRNGRPHVKIRFQIIMVKSSNEWYVDPASLQSNDIVADETASADTAAGDAGDGSAVVTPTPSPKPTAAPGAKTKLYYNKKGGKYYHSDANCASVNAEYLPLTNFYYKDLNSTTFKNLLPCEKCNAPQRP